MKKLILLIALPLVILTACTNQSNPVEPQQTNDSIMKSNPFLSAFNTPFNVPPFDKIKIEHYLPAINAAIDIQRKEIEAIVNNDEAPNFENTIVAYDNSGALLDDVENTLDIMSDALTSEALQQVLNETSPILTKHRDDIKLNVKLFERIKVVYSQKEDLSLTTEQTNLLEKLYQKFIRGGADLAEDKKARFRQINEKIAVLNLDFGNNVLAETNSFKLIIENQDDLAGLPESVIAGGAETAKEAGMEGKWVFTLQNPSYVPFMQYSAKRDLREKMFKAYTNRGNNNNEFDNKGIVEQLVKLRYEKAHLLGFDSHAAFILDENMAKTPDHVYGLLNDLMPAGLRKAKEEAVELQKMIDREKGGFKLQAWDWFYCAERLKKEKYAVDEEATRPYFKLENVLEGAFAVAGKLYGITFTKNSTIPVYYPEAVVYEVKEKDGSHIGLLYTDFFPRDSKRGGAWMSAFRKQSKRGGQEIPPVISIVCNFSKPTDDKPALLSFDEVQTLFHEFGHALHGLLSNCTYHTLSGTDVTRDFVEMPSQIMENWAAEPEVLKMYAKHYVTGEIIPQELLDKLSASSLFNTGFATTEYLSAAILDMDWHTISDTSNIDVIAFENASIKKMKLIDEIVLRYRSTYFNHIFSGGYSAGYYSYVWAEILDADAFEAFKSAGIFDAKTAQSFRDNILSKGNTDDLMKLYKQFRGAEPTIDALKKRKGFE